MLGIAEYDNDIARNIAGIRHLIDQHGWCRGRLVDQEGQVCIMGARAVAMGRLRTDGCSNGTEYDLKPDPTLRFLAARAGVESVDKFNDSAPDQAAITEFLIEAQLAAMNYAPGPPAAPHQPQHRPADTSSSDLEDLTAALKLLL